MHLSGTGLKSWDADIGFKSSPPQGASGSCWSPALTVGCWAGSGVCCESVSQPLLPVLMSFAHQLLKSCFTSSWGSFRGNCSVWSWRVRVSVDGGGLRIALWHSLEREPPAALLSLTQDINRSSRLARNRPKGLGRAPRCPSLPSPTSGLALCPAERKSPPQACRWSEGVRPDHTDTRCSRVPLEADIEKQVCSWLGNPSDSAGAKQKKSDSVFLERWRLNSPTVLQGPPEKPRLFPHWTSAC